MLATRLAAVFLGAGIGGCARYALSLSLNPLLIGLPLGTLAVNLLGGYLAGVAAGYFLFATQLPEEWRLFAMTGFLGGLTTFSAFSVEMVALLQAGRNALALAGIALHVVGSLALTALGLLTVRTALGTS